MDNNMIQFLPVRKKAENKKAEQFKKLNE